MKVTMKFSVENLSFCRKYKNEKCPNYESFMACLIFSVLCMHELFIHILLLLRIVGFSFIIFNSLMLLLLNRKLDFNFQYKFSKQNDKYIFNFL